MVTDFLDSRRGLQPLRAARHELGYSVEALASTLSVGAPTIRQAEWGLYNDVPPRIATFFIDNDYAPEWIEKENSKYRVETRFAFGEEYGDLFPAPSPNFLQVLYRNLECGRLTLAKCLCIQPSELLRMDSNPESNFTNTMYIALAHCITPEYAQAMVDAWPRKSSRA